MSKGNVQITIFVRQAIWPDIILSILQAYAKKEQNESFIFFQLLAIFGLIIETAKKMNIELQNSSLKKEDIITYLHQNIYHPKRIRIQKMALHFNISPHYFSHYFKRNFEISLREYIDEYRLKLIEKRMEMGENTIKQIAFEFGFTDESHLSHYYKKKRNRALSSLKKE